MNILYIVNESALGGAAQSMLDMLSAKRGAICPTVIIPSHGVIEDRLNEMGVPYFVVPFLVDHAKIGTTSQEDRDRVFYSNYTAAMQLQGIIRDREIQLIHTNSSVSNVGAIAALMANLPHVWHIRELLEEDFDCEFIDKMLKERLFHCTNSVITISDCVKDKYKNAYQLETERIYNGMNVAKYLVKNKAEKWNLNFMIAGAVSEGKGQFDVIRAVENLIKEGYEGIHLDVIGPTGYQYGWLLSRYIRQHHLEDVVTMYPFQSDLSLFRKKCSYAITASKMEALGRVTIEAMLSRNVVIGADTGGTAEIIGADETRGYLYRHGDADSLAETMKKAIRNQYKNQEMLDAAQDYARTTFDPDAYVQKIWQTYEKTMAQPTRNSEEKKKLLKVLDERYKRLPDAEWRAEQPDDIKSKVSAVIQQWEDTKKAGKTIGQVLRGKNIKRIAIYGIGKLGCMLYDELENSGIEICYVMDKGIKNNMGVINLIDLSEELPQADALIVTVLRETDSLVRDLENKTTVPVLKLSELLDWSEEKGNANDN